MNIDKKFAFMIFGAVLVLAGAIYANAFGGSTPSVMGHSVGEIEGVQERVSGLCEEGSSIRIIDSTGAVTCEANTDTQDLSISGNTISLTNGGSVTLPSGGADTKVVVAGRFTASASGGKYWLNDQHADNQYRPSEVGDSSAIKITGDNNGRWNADDVWIFEFQPGSELYNIGKDNYYFEIHTLETVGNYIGAVKSIVYENNQVKVNLEHFNSVSEIWSWKIIIDG